MTFITVLCNQVSLPVSISSSAFSAHQRGVPILEQQPLRLCPGQVKARRGRQGHRGRRVQPDGVRVFRQGQGGGHRATRRKGYFIKLQSAKRPLTISILKQDPGSDFAFGTALEAEAASGATAKARILTEIEKEGLCHPDLFGDAKEREERWIRKLYAARREAMAAAGGGGSSNG